MTQCWSWRQFDRAVRRRHHQRLGHPGPGAGAALMNAADELDVLDPTATDVVALNLHHVFEKIGATIVTSSRSRPGIGLIASSAPRDWICHFTRLGQCRPHSGEVCVVGGPNICDGLFLRQVLDLDDAGGRVDVDDPAGFAEVLQLRDNDSSLAQGRPSSPGSGPPSGFQVELHPFRSAR